MHGARLSKLTRTRSTKRCDDAYVPVELSREVAAQCDPPLLRIGGETNGLDLDVLEANREAGKLYAVVSKTLRTAWASRASGRL